MKISIENLAEVEVVGKEFVTVEDCDSICRLVKEIMSTEHPEGPFLRRGQIQ